MISNINEAISAIKNSEYSDVIITDKREGQIADEYFYGFYVTRDSHYSLGKVDPFGFGLLVSETGKIDCLSGMMSMAMLEMLKPVR